MNRYVCPAFQLPVHGRKITLSEELRLDSGDICVVYGDSNPSIQDLLYLLAGLHRLRGLTSPAEGGYGRQQVDSPVPDITLSGIRIYSLPERERAAQISFIYENPEVAIIGRTVIDEFQYSFAALERRPAMGGAMALEPYGLQYKGNCSTDVLSGGEKHRLNCACALEVKPAMIIADFSSSNLDSDFFEEFLANLSDFAARGGIVITAGVRVDQLPRLKATLKYLVFNPGTISFSSSPVPPSWAIPVAEEQNVFQAQLTDRLIDSTVVLTASELFVIGRTRSPFSVTIQAGEIIVCRSPNGWGKTTIGQVIAKRLKKYSGEILPVSQRSTLAIQHAERAVLFSTVADALRNDRELASICGFTDEELRQHPRELNRAKQKLLSITQALYNASSLAILDEPTCGMDTAAKSSFARLLNRYPKLAILIFTHDPALFSIGRELTWN